MTDDDEPKMTKKEMDAYHKHGTPIPPLKG